MTATDRGSPENPLPTGSPKSPIVANLSGDQLVSFLVQITRGIWRLGSALERNRTRGEPVSEAIQGMVEHLHEDLESFGFQVNDPAGEPYAPGMRVEIAHLETGGSGDLVIKRTVLPGVSLNGAMLIPASVVVGREESS